MTDFDKLIKQKTEENDFEFSNSEWMKFRRKAGLKPAYPLYAAVAAAVATAAVATAIYFSAGNSTPPPSKNEPTPAVAENTADSSSESQENAVFEVITEENPSSGANTVTKNNHVRNGDFSGVKDAGDNITPKKSEKTVTRIYANPLRINVDTIKDDRPSDEELEKGNSRLF